MTRDKAISTLKYIGSDYKNCAESIAIDMAIKALENESVLDKIREDIDTIIGEHNLEDYDFCSGLIRARKIIDKYKTRMEK